MAKAGAIHAAADRTFDLRDRMTASGTNGIGRLQEKTEANDDSNNNKQRTHEQGTKR